MNRHALRTSILALALVAYAGVAHGAYDLDELKRLYQRGDAEAAYGYAVTHRSDREGNPQFDYFYGVAAIDSGHVSEGVFALERVLILFPRDDRARLELARGYFLLQEDRRARTEFEAVLERNPPAQVQANIQRFLDAIRLRERRFRTTATAFLEMSSGYDSNVNSATADANFTTPTLGSGVLTGGSLEQEDYFAGLSLGGQFEHPLQPGKFVFGQVRVDTRRYADEHDFENDSISAELGFEIFGERNRFRLSALGQHFRLDNESFRNLLGVNAEVRRSFGNSTQGTGFLQVANLDYPQQSVRDSTLITGGIAGTQSFDGPLSPLVFGSLYGGVEDARSDGPSAQAVADRKLLGVRLGGQLTLTPTVAVGAAGAWQRSEYTGDDVLFLVARRDNFYSVESSITWLFLKNWSLSGQFRYYINESNIAINEYDRIQAGVKLRYDYF